MTFLILQASILLLLFFPALGVLGLLWILIRVAIANFSQIVKNSINRALAVLSVWLVINSFLAYQPSEAFLGLANFLPFFALFGSLSIAIRYPHQLRRIAWILVISALPIVILGLGQLYLNWQSPPLIKTILGWGLVAQGVPTGRMSSVFIYANFLAIYLAIAFILGLGLWLDVWQNHSLKKRNWLLLLLSIVLIFNSIGLGLASSRNAWGIAMIGIMAFAIYFSWYWLISIVTAMGIAIMGASFGSFWGQEWLRKIVPMFIWSRLSDQNYLDRPIATLRITQWQFCWEKIQENPLIGWGLRNFTPLYLEATNFWLGHPHNLFFMLGMEIGIIGGLFFCLIIAWILAQAFLLLRRSPRRNSRILTKGDRLILFSYLVAFGCCILFNLLDITIFDLRINLLGWILLSAIYGVSQELTQDKHKISLKMRGRA
ncbi:lipid A core-O-antigen ligase-like enyme [Xenococcus sp. PCC 7305]|uniref:O-antigen ligase family protein n=1 Tax=Xenococcus sp. PCC 7305 TaxID=102125 RepID=UPI0002AC5C1A|nr:O-antigen ligase family protein [Xenococcus sp. PCC 7305]ELS05174.1 lipid A core-O-antigen ligase-like enyme [Xenococcus sp. PCC 7305]